MMDEKTKVVSMVDAEFLTNLGIVNEVIGKFDRGECGFCDILTLDDSLFGSLDRTREELLKTGNASLEMLASDVTGFQEFVLNEGAVSAKRYNSGNLFRAIYETVGLIGSSSVQSRLLERRFEGRFNGSSSRLVLNSYDANFIDSHISDEFKSDPFTYSILRVAMAISLEESGVTLPGQRKDLYTAQDKIGIAEFLKTQFSRDQLASPEPISLHDEYEDNVIKSIKFAGTGIVPIGFVITTEQFVEVGNLLRNHFKGSPAYSALTQFRCTLGFDDDLDDLPEHTEFASIGYVVPEAILYDEPSDDFSVTEIIHRNDFPIDDYRA